MIFSYYMLDGKKHIIWEIDGIRREFTENPEDVYYQRYLELMAEGAVEIEIPVPEPPVVVYGGPVVATDFLIASPIPKDKPKEAFDEMLAESKKPKGNNKSLGLMMLDLMVYIEDLENRIAKLETKNV